MNKMEFTRGDQNSHSFSMPADLWEAGGKLFFAAKPVIDDDSTDSAAIISRVFDDSVVEDVTIGGIAYKKYTCVFPPSDTNSIESGGAGSLDYEAEFQWVSADASVVRTFPASDQKIDAVVYFDVKRKTVE